MVSAIYIFDYQNTEAISDVTLLNIEALSDEEWSEYPQCYMDSNYLICSPFCVGVACTCK